MRTIDVQMKELTRRADVRRTGQRLKVCDIREMVRVISSIVTLGP
jgi:hypothetical protein